MFTERSLHMSTPELLSLEEFFGPPVRSGAAISPDGRGRTV